VGSLEDRISRLEGRVPSTHDAVLSEERRAEIRARLQKVIGEDVDKRRRPGCRRGMRLSARRSERHAIRGSPVAYDGGRD
jgi:hypothetical protein